MKWFLLKSNFRQTEERCDLREIKFSFNIFLYLIKYYYKGKESILTNTNILKQCREVSLTISSVAGKMCQTK